MLAQYVMLFGMLSMILFGDPKANLKDPAKEKIRRENIAIGKAIAAQEERERNKSGGVPSQEEIQRVLRRMGHWKNYKYMSSRLKRFWDRVPDKEKYIYVETPCDPKMQTCL